MCALCAASAKRRTAFSQINLMHPGAAPSYLPTLSSIEESLIALHCPILKVIRLKGGSLGYSGNCVAVTQDLQTFVTKRSICDTNLTIVVPFCNATDEAPKSLRVSSLKIKRWLMFLIEHNPLYAGISIDENALTALPSNGNDFQHLLPLICIAAGDDDPAPADGEINVQGIMGDNGEKPEQVSHARNQAKRTRSPKKVIPNQLLLLLLEMAYLTHPQVITLTWNQPLRNQFQLLQKPMQSACGLNGQSLKRCVFGVH